MPPLQVELQQAETASEDKAAALQADIADLQQRLAAAEADLAAAQARVQQLEQQLQAQQAEAAATEKRMTAQMDQLKMDVSFSPLLLCHAQTMCHFPLLHLSACAICEPTKPWANHGSEDCFGGGSGLCSHFHISGLYVSSAQATCKAALKIERLTAWSKDHVYCGQNSCSSASSSAC